MHVALLASGALFTLHPDAPGWPGEGEVPPDRSAAGFAWRLWSSGQYAIRREEGSNSVHFDVEALLALDEAELRELGLPVRFAGRVAIEESGQTNGSRYDWRFRWEDGDGRLLADTPPLGPWFPGPRGYELLTAGLADIAELHSQLAGALGRDDRLRLLARMHRLATGCGAMVRLPGARRVVEVDRVQVGVATAEDGTQTATAIPAKAEGGSVEPVDLEPEQQRRVRVDTPWNGGVVDVGGRANVIVDPDAAANMNIIALFSQADPETRARFVENPEAFLPYPDAFDERDYAARVIGIVAAPRGAAATERSTQQSWLPDDAPELPGGGLVIQLAEGEILVPDGEIPKLRKAVKEAVDRGETTVQWGPEGTSIPVSAALAEQLGKLTPNGHPTGEKGLKQPLLILQIRENNIDLSWARHRGAARGGEPGDGLPAGLRVEPKPHQREALAWLSQRWTEGWSGALLCDDMGLGKTFQALAFAAWVRPRIDPATVHVPILVVAPTSLLPAWVRELEDRFEPNVLPRVGWGHLAADPPRSRWRAIEPLRGYVEGGAARAAVLTENRFDIEAIRAANLDVVVTNYETIRRYQFSFGKLRVGVIILDEAQGIKNDTSLQSRAARAMNYDFGLILTGTPIENSWRDLWTLCDFAVPGYLGSAAEFMRSYPDTEDRAAVGQRLSTRVEDVLMRRTRAVALPGLPSLTLDREAEPMPPLQAELYLHAVRNRKQGGSRQVMLGLLQRLAAISLHPRQQAEFHSRADVADWVAESARTRIAWRWLDRYAAEGHAVLLFVRSRAAQPTLSRALRRWFDLPEDVPVLSGEVDAEDRPEIVDRVRSGQGFRPLIISPGVGGVGWNLQFATRALLLERPYNPAVEAQMVARIHRLGQEQDVRVGIPLATLDGRPGVTFDEKLDGLLAAKSELATTVLAPSASGDDELLWTMGQGGDF
jgi:hypothetical protein